MNRTRQEIEALADIFVGQPPPVRDLPADRVAILLEGHLPVRGALWRLAAAGLVAEGNSATLLDVDDRHLHATALGGAMGPASTVEHLIGGVDAGHLWILAGSDMPSLMSEVRAADELIIVTGADQAAVVGAYRLAKQVITAAADGVGVGVIIAGSPQAVADEVWDRLSETLRGHLSVEPRLVGVLPQLDVSAKPDRTTVPMPSGGAAVLFDVIRTRGCETAPTEPPVTRVETVAPPAVRTPQIASPEPHPTAPLAPAPPSSAGALPEGLHAVEIETPLPASIQLACDASGCPHLVTDEAGMPLLEAARRWASGHQALLAAAVDGIDARAEVMCDLLVGDYHRAAALAGGLWTVHLVHDGGMLEVPPPESGPFGGF